MAADSSSLQSLYDIQEYIPPATGAALTVWLGLAVVLLITILLYRFLRNRTTHLRSRRLLDQWRRDPSSGRLVCHKLHSRLTGLRKKQAARISDEADRRLDELEKLLKRLRFQREAPDNARLQQVSTLVDSLEQTGVRL